MLNKSAIRKVFHLKNMRVPSGAMDVLESLVFNLVNIMAESGHCFTRQDANGLAAKSGYPHWSRYVNAAFDKLEKEGKIDSDGNVIGGSRVWFGTAKQLQLDDIKSSNVQ